MSSEGILAKALGVEDSVIDGKYDDRPLPTMGAADMAKSLDNLDTMYQAHGEALPAHLAAKRDRLKGEAQTSSGG